MRIKCNSACFLSLILLALTASTGTAQQYSASQPQMQQSNSIHWLNDIANAKQLAAQSGRHVYIHFYSDNCAACDTVERHCLRNPEFVRAIQENFIPVRVNVDQSPSVVRKWRVRRWPTDVVIDSEGNKHFDSITNPNATAYIERLKAVYETVAATPLNIDSGFSMEPEMGDTNVAPASFPTTNQRGPTTTSNPNIRTARPVGPPVVTGAPALPNQRTLGLQGHCPVSLYAPSSPDKVWVKGHPQIGIRHRGVVYLFASQEHKRVFLSNPDRFSPVLSGYDPVIFTNDKKLVTGDRKFGVKFRDRIYLFVSEESLKTFWTNPERFALKSLEAMFQAR